MHPGTAKSSEAASRRQEQGDHLQPPRAFERFALLWCDQQHRLPTEEDWAVLLGLPASWVAPLRRHHLATLALAPPQQLLAPLLLPLLAHARQIERPRAGGTGERLGRLRPVFERHSHLFAPPSHPANLFAASLRRKGLNPASFGAPAYPELDARGEAWAAVGQQRGAATSRWAPPPLVVATS